MEKRYQVFVSSTYTDLIEERSKIFQTLMEMDCFPAGMELFPAVDEDQFKFIKRVIDDSDYYLVIIGGRYGSISSEGISYTEKEYDYAIEKGLKVMALIHEKPDIIPSGKTDSDPTARAKLELLRKKIAQGRLVKFYTSASELPGLVALSLSKTMKLYPAVGWMRANLVTNLESLSDLNQMRKENEELKKQLSYFSNEEVIPEINYLADLDELVTFEIAYSAPEFEDNHFGIRYCDRTWRDIFRKLSKYILLTRTEAEIKTYLISELFQYQDFDVETPKYFLKDSFTTLQFQFELLRYVEVLLDNKDENNSIWKLTSKGKKAMYEIYAIKSKKPFPSHE